MAQVSTLQRIQNRMNEAQSIVRGSNDTVETSDGVWLKRAGKPAVFVAAAGAIKGTFGVAAPATSWGWVSHNPSGVRPTGPVIQTYGNNSLRLHENARSADLIQFQYTRDSDAASLVVNVPLIGVGVAPWVEVEVERAGNRVRVRKSESLTDDLHAVAWEAWSAWVSVGTTIRFTDVTLVYVYAGTGADTLGWRVWWKRDGTVAVTMDPTVQPLQSDGTWGGGFEFVQPATGVQCVFVDRDRLVFDGTNDIMRGDLPNPSLNGQSCTQLFLIEAQDPGASSSTEALYATRTITSGGHPERGLVFRADRQSGQEGVRLSLMVGDGISGGFNTLSATSDAPYGQRCVGGWRYDPATDQAEVLIFGSGELHKDAGPDLSGFGDCTGDGPPTLGATSGGGAHARGVHDAFVHSDQYLSDAEFIQLAEILLEGF